MDNTLGSVHIEIRGDLSKLQGDFSAAEALAVRAGTGMSQGLNQASVGADKVVFAIGRLAGVVEQQSAQMSLAFQRNIATLANFEQGAGRAEQGIRKVGTASEGTVPQMAAVSGAIRTAFGEQSIRAVERFLTLIPGMGAALQFAFPVIGAIALYEAISRVLDKSDQLKAAEKELADAVTQTDNAMREQSQTVDRIRAKSLGREFGPAAEQEAQARAMRQQALDYYEDINKLTAANKQAVVDYAAAHPMRAPLSMDDWSRLKQVPEVQEKIKANEEKIDELTAKSTAKIAEAYDLMAQSARTRSEEGGKLSAKRIELEQQAAQRATEISRQRYTAEIDLEHAAAEQRIAGMVSEYARVVATGQEEIRFEKAKQDEIAGYALATRDRTIKAIAAKAGAESAGKSAPEQAIIQAGAQGDTQKAKDDYTLSVGKAALDVQKSQADATRKLDELNLEVARTLANDVREGWDKVTEAAHRSQEAMLEAETKDIQAKTRVAEIEDKAKGEVKALEIKRQEIELEGRYAATLNHSLADRIAYLNQIAGLEHQEREAKLAGLKAELADAEALKGEVRDLVKIAELKRQIAIAAQEDANASAVAANKAKELAVQKSLAGQISAQLPQGSLLDKATAVTASTIAGAVDGISSALAKAAIQGKGLGNALKQAGQNLAMTAVTGLLKAGLSSALQALMQLIPAFGAVAAAQTGAAAAAKAATSATDVGEAEGNAAVAATGAAAAVAWIPLIGPALAVAAAASMLASLQPYVGLAAFAEGTDSAPGGMAMVGERGPELMYVPRGAQIIPNHRLGHFADGVGSFATSSFSSSVQANHFHGPMHFHGVQSVDGMMREIALRVKTASPGASKYAR